MYIPVSFFQHTQSLAIASALLKGPVSFFFWLSQSAVLFLVGCAAIINLFCWAQEKQVELLIVLSNLPRDQVRDVPF
jgi:hypothetical protein